MNFNTLVGLVKIQASKYKEKLVLICDEKSTSFSALDSNSSKIANGLLENNIDSYDRVAFLGRDSISTYEILFGCTKAKAVYLPINWRLTQSEIYFIIDDSKTKLIFVEEEFVSVIESIKNELNSSISIIVIDSKDNYSNFDNWKSSRSSSFLDLDYDSKDIVVQMYTSGTTGFPKGVELCNETFFELRRNMEIVNDNWIDLNCHDKLLLSLPIFHIGGMYWAIQSISGGATGIVLPMFEAWKALESIEKFKITKVAMVPAMMQFCVLESQAHNFNLSTVEAFIYGGSPIAESLLKAAMKLFQCDFFQVYGMTETGNMATCLRPSDHKITHLRKSVGKPYHSVKVKVVDKELNVLNKNQIGEICIQSPSNMIRYWNNDKANNKIMLDKWIRTGDAGYVNEDGYVFICDRIKDMIIYAGENIYPKEIENVLIRRNDISAVAIIGVPDEKWGEIVKAVIVPKPSSSLNKTILVNYLKGEIADYKIPRSFSFVESLPRNTSGKILKNELKLFYGNKS